MVDPAQKPYKLSMKVVVKDQHGKCLLLRRSQDSKNNKGKWDFPGGKVDPGEDFDQALLREVVEETGLIASLQGVAGSAESELPDRRVAYLIMEAVVTSGKVTLSSEHNNFVWVERAKMAEMDLCPQFRTFAETYSRS